MPKFPRVPAKFSPGANPNTPIPKEFCVLKYDWFAVISIPVAFVLSLGEEEVRKRRLADFHLEPQISWNSKEN